MRISSKETLVGKRFGTFMVISESAPIEGWKVRLWNAKCDCGSSRIYSSGQLRLATSCGCLKKARMSKKRRTEKQISDLKNKNGVWSDTVNRSARRGIQFSLTRSVFEELSEKNCTYCDSPPSNRYSNNGYYYFYQGLDRVNNDLGYEDGNCVPCCKICNAAKNNLSVEQFLEWANRVVNKSLKGKKC